MTSTGVHRPITTKLRASSPPLRWRPAVVLHLAPGVALVLFFLVTAPVLDRAGLPPVWGLLLGTLLVLAPTELGAVVHSARRGGAVSQANEGRDAGRYDVVHSARRGGAVSPWRALGLHPVRRGDLGRLLLAGALAALAPGLVVWLEPVLHGTLFGWLPDWFAAGVGDLSSYPPAVAAATVALWLVSQVVVGPVAEEIYFRGWLLPRLPGGRVAASTGNAALFGIYHLWQPYAVLTVFLFALPLADLVRTRRNPTLSIIVHCTVNLLAFAALVAGALHR